MYYKIFVPICFQVLPILRLQIDIFVELFVEFAICTQYIGAFRKISAQSVKYKQTRNLRHLKNVIFLIYFLYRKILGPNSAR